MQYLVYLTYPAMILLLIIGSKVCKKGQWNDDFMNYDQTKYLQGYLAICIMFHHIGQEMCAPWQTYRLYPGLEFFVPLGYLFVGVFFLCSGYGLYVSYENKPDYLCKGFFRRRVLPLIIGYYASSWIFFIVRVIMGEPMNSWKIFCYIIGIKLSNPYSWFALIMPVFYIFFYLAFKYSKRPVRTVIFCVFGYTFLGTCINHNDYLMIGQWWYNCVQMFWMGILLAKYKDRLEEWAKKKYVLKLILCILLFHVSWYFAQFTQETFSYYGEYVGLPMTLTVAFRWICLVGDMLCTTFFGAMIVIAGLKIKIGNRWLGFMGTITFEFYIIHGLVIELFSYRFCDVAKPIVRITNGALMAIVVFTASIPLALGMKRICHMFSQKKEQL